MSIPSPPMAELPLLRGAFFSCAKRGFYFVVLAAYVKLPVTVSVTVPGVTMISPSGPVV